MASHGRCNFKPDLLVCGELDPVLEVPGDLVAVLPAPMVGLQPLPGQHGLGLPEKSFLGTVASCHLESLITGNKFSNTGFYPFNIDQITQICS